MMMSILDLNDDCLRVIFDFFSIYQLIELEKVCKAFKSVCNNVYTTRRFHKMRIELRDLKAEYFEDIFDKVGHTLRNFEFSGGYIMDENVKWTMINGVTQSCSKLHSLTVNYTQFTPTNFIKLQQCFTRLTYLDLSRCGIYENSLGLSLDSERFPHIKTLKLAGNSCMNGSFFQKMNRVEVLDISYCYELEFEKFVIFLQNCIRLIDLDVSASCRLVHGVDDFVSVIHMHQPDVERLLMENTGVAVEAEILSRFSKLKVCCFEGRRLGT